MEIQEFTEIVETMAMQHDFPGYDVRSLRLGLPQAVVKSPVKLFVEALQQDNVLVKLAALRWYWERPGDAKRCLHSIAQLLADKDEWVRMEAIKVLSRVDKVDETIVVQIAHLLEDPDLLVSQAAAKACGKLGCRAKEVLVALRMAATHENRELRWKAQKALRQLGEYT